MTVTPPSWGQIGRASPRPSSDSEGGDDKIHQKFLSSVTPPKRLPRAVSPGALLSPAQSTESLVSNPL